MPWIDEPMTSSYPYLVMDLAETLSGISRCGFPHESCGCVTLDDRVGFIAHRLGNIARNPIHEFLIDPEDVYSIRLAHGDPFAFFHSHPGSPPDISLADMQWMDAVAQCGYTNKMIIVGLEPIVEVRCYEKWDHGYRVIWRYEEKHHAEG